MLRRTMFDFAYQALGPKVSGRAASKFVDPDKDLGWQDLQGIDFFKDNAAKTEADIVNEIDRYLAMPGQALAYKIGQLKMLEIRAHAERTLGQDFDIRNFHDALLGGGALPLELLEIRMNRWLAEELRRLRD